jgi:colanic acid biosynthesis protein WcaH
MIDYDGILKKINPAAGLDDELFKFVSALTPLVNVDLLVKNDNGQTLLTWRDDEFFGPGWHIPGGIIRYKESIKSRILKVLESEIKVKKVKKISDLILINEYISTKKIRGHGISFLFRCNLYQKDSKKFSIFSAAENKKYYAFQAAWHNSCPVDLIKEQKCFSSFI